VKLKLPEIPMWVLVLGTGVAAAAMIFAVGMGLLGAARPDPEMNLVHPDRKLPHVVYLRDTAGDCIALYGMSLTRASNAIIQHVEKRWCE
jgi:hypothetical protein